MRSWWTRAEAAVAETPHSQLIFTGECPDCGERRADLPPPLPVVRDDFDWRLRDYDDFRRFLMEELAARFPERRRWNPADLEVVLVEVLAAVLDQLSDMADRVAAEATLETARRPESVRQLLALIGYDATRHAPAEFDVWKKDHPGTEAEALESFWTRNPQWMQAARREGPRTIRTQHRMVTLDDYAVRLEEHPVVLRAHAWSRWSGAWNTINIAAIVWDGKEEQKLDTKDLVFTPELAAGIMKFNKQRGLPPLWPEETGAVPSTAVIRTILRPYLDTHRMAGQEVLLQDAQPVPVSMAFSVRVAPNYFQSEVRQAIQQALGTGPEGFFRPGRLRFGEDLHASDLLEALMALDGIENICLNRFKRLGSQFPDQAQSGVIIFEDIEIAVCDNNSRQPGRGYYRLTLQGGKKG